MTRPTCGSCPYVIADDNGDHWCHRFPPQMLMGSPAPSSWYPVVGEDKPGCAEHPEWGKPQIKLPRKVNQLREVPDGKRAASGRRRATP